MIFNYLDFRGNKGSIDIVDTSQENILKQLPKKYHTDSIIKISREKNKIFITPMSTRATNKNSVTELMFLK